MARPANRSLSALLASVLLLSPALARGQADDPRFQQAKEHFQRAVEHTDRNEWDAALVEFLKSRELFPTAKNTYNAAVCLRRLNRFDEALDMYESLLRDFRDVSPADRAVSERELAQLKTSVGAIALEGGVPGAAVIIDGRERGTLPLRGPARVGAGTHTVRVSRDGFLPFEARVDVAGMQTAPLKVELVALTAGGRLQITEQSGRTLDVVVDDAVVGKTPWHGLLAPGAHAVLLRGEDRLGTQPVLASVKLNQTVRLQLLAEVLDGSLRVRATPLTAAIRIDGVPVGRGAWEGRLRAGTHTVEVAAEGYLPFAREIDLGDDAPKTLEAALARDPTAFAGRSGIFGLEVDASAPLGIVFGGDVSSCRGACSRSLPVGVHAVLRGIYEAGSGFGGGVDVGYLLVTRTVGGRDAPIAPVGRPPNPGTADDDLRLSALVLGASAQYRIRASWSVLLRFGAGVMLGSMRDERSGSFVNGSGGAYSVARSARDAATYIYSAPEIRLGRRIGAHLEVSFGAEVLLLAALSQPKWRDDWQILTTDDPTAQGDGQGTFGEQSLLGSFALFLAPSVGARYAF
jgi:hypothetical protein